MSARFVATVGNGRLLARIGADGSLLGLSGPHLDKELLVRPVHATLELPSGRKRRIGGLGWKHRREEGRGTKTLGGMSRPPTAIKVQRGNTPLHHTPSPPFPGDRPGHPRLAPRLD